VIVELERDNTRCDARINRANATIVVPGYGITGLNDGITRFDDGIPVFDADVTDSNDTTTVFDRSITGSSPAVTGCESADFIPNAQPTRREHHVDAFERRSTKSDASTSRRSGCTPHSRTSNKPDRYDSGD
jgi:hypothetical protein